VGCGYLYFGITDPKVVHGRARKDPSVEKPPKSEEEKDKVETILKFLAFSKKIMCSVRKIVP
jgi:hypothetical protein